MAAWLDVADGAIHVLLGSDQVPYESVFIGRLDVPGILEAALSKLREIFEAVIDGRYRQARVVLLDDTVAHIDGVFDLPTGPLRHRVWRRRSLLRRQRREVITFAPY